jgi:hypothetical protein
MLAGCPSHSHSRCACLATALQESHSSRLEHVPIIRVQVAHLGLLVLGQAHVVRLLAPAILSQARDEVDDAGGGAEADEAQADAVALVEEGLCVGRLEAVAGDDAADLRTLDFDFELVNRQGRDLRFQNRSARRYRWRVDGGRPGSFRTNTQ